MKKIYILVTGLIICFQAYNQELRCNIQLVTSKLQGTNKQVFQTMQTAMTEFMNNTAWTGYKFSSNERIECTFLFNFTDMKGDDEFIGTLQIQVRRPVFNSSYSSVLFNYVDNDIDFRYVEFQALEFSETSYLSGLTSLLAYYAYIILGIDFDSFGLSSGTEFYQKAEKIVMNAQNAAEKGWRASESLNRRNRYWLVNSLLNPDYQPVREFIYKYHRLGLDMMYDKPFEGRSKIIEGLTLLQDVHRNRPDPFLYLIQVICDAKSDEFINIFKEATDDEKRRVITILNQIDAPRKEKYAQIVSASK